MTKFTKDPSTHPANGPLTEERLIRVRDELAAAAKRSDGGNLGYMMADAAKAIEELLALRKAEQEPVAWPNHCDSTIPAALRFLAEKPRPIYGNSPYNTEHLYQLAREIEMITRRPLYAAPQLPQPAVVNADDNFYSWFGREWHENYQHNQYTSAAKQMLGVMAESAWRAGRSAAMLQGNHRDLSHPVDPQVAAYEKIMEQAVPDGWVAVPVEPTEEMVIAGFEAELHEEFRAPEAWEAFEAMSGCEQAAHRARWCWSAMIAAAPQPDRN
ncbi:hypothetical protein [Leclercia adecarboxylata]|uniref:hypothetical protein n=1 Tax=Leclercia adecarboxylata TaxID=83655 RepID=UPI002550B215|nr:hypothetical protein [Leclercia adecarboxylata]